MDYVPHTQKDVQEMLGIIGVNSVNELFSDVKPELLNPITRIPSGLSEHEVMGLMQGIGSKNKIGKCSFLGAGAYHHFIPSVVKHLVGRSEFYTAYTPYQAEMSQGLLQAVYEYQTMIANLTGMDVSNASMYDGASALAESCVMACNITRRNKIVLSNSVHPDYRATVKTYCDAHGYTLVEVDSVGGITDAGAIGNLIDDETAALLIQTPNFFGCVEDVKALSETVHEQGALLVTCITEMLSLGIVKSPGSLGADIVVGEGQSLGNAVSFGGPYLGVMATKTEYVRQLPGRLVGRSQDNQGRPGFILTLQAREQHIRREKASCNICTNQALNAMTATVYLAYLGKKGITKVAEANLQKAQYFMKQCKQVGKLPLFEKPFFNEVAINVKNPKVVTDQFDSQNMVAGVDLGNYYSQYINTMLFCVTELLSKEDIDQAVSIIGGIE